MKLSNQVVNLQVKLLSQTAVKLEKSIQRKLNQGKFITNFDELSPIIDAYMGISLLYLQAGDERGAYDYKQMAISAGKNLQRLTGHINFEKHINLYNINVDNPYKNIA